MIISNFSSCLSLDHGYFEFQCYEGKPLLEFDRKRVFRSGLVGFSLHGSLSHYYYQFCEVGFMFSDVKSLLIFEVFMHSLSFGKFICRLCFLSVAGGLFLPKLFLIKQYGQQFGIASIMLAWVSCVLNLHLLYLTN